MLPFVHDFCLCVFDFHALLFFYERHVALPPAPVCIITMSLFGHVLAAHVSPAYERGDHCLQLNVLFTRGEKVIMASAEMSDTQRPTTGVYFELDSRGPQMLEAMDVFTWGGDFRFLTPDETFHVGSFSSFPSHITNGRLDSVTLSDDVHLRVTRRHDRYRFRIQAEDLSVGIHEETLRYGYVQAFAIASSKAKNAIACTLGFAKDAPLSRVRNGQWPAWRTARPVHTGATARS